MYWLKLSSMMAVLTDISDRPRTTVFYKLLENKQWTILCYWPKVDMLTMIFTHWYDEGTCLLNFGYSLRESWQQKISQCWRCWVSWVLQQRTLWNNWRSPKSFPRWWFIIWTRCWIQLHNTWVYIIVSCDRVCFR